VIPNFSLSWKFSESSFVEISNIFVSFPNLTAVCSSNLLAIPDEAVMIVILKAVITNM
jgi:hypothetical protein